MPVFWLGTEPCHSAELVGGKAANLSALALEFRVPPGFAVAGLSGAPRFDETLAAEVRAAYVTLGERVGGAEPHVAVRSSAIDEDSAGASFAGQHATFLNVRGADDVLAAIAQCWRSAGTAGALAYRSAQGVPADDVRMAVLVQTLVPADVAAVAFSAHPVTGSRGQVVINANWGLGESIVSGLVTPDTYIVDKRTWDVPSRDIGSKESMTVRTDAGTREEATPEALRMRRCLNDAQAAEVARLASALETRMGWPVDIECAFAEGTLWLLQCRPITRLPTN